MGPDGQTILWSCRIGELTCEELYTILFFLFIADCFPLLPWRMVCTQVYPKCHNCSAFRYRMYKFLLNLLQEMFKTTWHSVVQRFAHRSHTNGVSSCSVADREVIWWKSYPSPSNNKNGKRLIYPFIRFLWLPIVCLCGCTRNTWFSSCFSHLIHARFYCMLVQVRKLRMT